MTDKIGLHIIGGWGGATMRLHRPLDKAHIVRISQRFNPPTHYGVDYSCAVGTPLYAPVAGRVYANEQPSGFGRYVRLETDDGNYVYLAHLRDFALGGGQRVQPGELVGWSGNTGNSTGPHLHFEVRKGGREQWRAVDPEPLIDWAWNGKESAVSKLGVHFQNVPHWHTRVINEGTCQWVKFIDPTGPYPYARPVNIIGRLWIGGDHVEQALIDQRAVGADKYFEMCLPRYRQAPWVTVWEGPNEPLPYWDRLQNLDAFSRQWVRRMHDAGLRCAVGGFSVGRPDTGTVHLVGRSIEMADFWHLHEYSQPRMRTDETWLCLRYRRTYDELRKAGFNPPPLLITELGIDGGAVTPQRQHEARPKKGWRTFVTWEQYQEDLTWYAREIEKDGYVAGATVFVSEAVQDPKDGWPDFHLNEDQTRWIASHSLSSVPVVPPTPEPPPPPDLYLPSVDEQAIRNAAWQALGIPYNPDAAFPKYARKHGLGNPVTRETDVAGCRLQGFSGGIVYARIGDWGNTRHIAW